MSISQEKNMDQKWEAQVSATAEKARVDQIWPLFQDFFGLHKWFPGLETCCGIQGTNGHPGCIRYCSGFRGIRPQPAENNINTNQEYSDTCKSSSSELFGWSKECLTSMDHAQMTLTYEMVESNIGFNSYVSTLRVVPRDRGGCSVEWSISVDPVTGWEVEDLVGKYRVGLELMLRKMEAAVVAAS